LLGNFDNLIEKMTGLLCDEALKTALPIDGILILCTYPRGKFQVLHLSGV